MLQKTIFLCISDIKKYLYYLFLKFCLLNQLSYAHFFLNCFVASVMHGAGRQLRKKINKVIFTVIVVTSLAPIFSSLAPLHKRTKSPNQYLII